MKAVRTIRGGVLNPSFIVIISSLDYDELWLFNEAEKDLAISYYWRFKGEGKDSVKLLERSWKEVWLG
jgi:hypothetical protein